MSEVPLYPARSHPPRWKIARKERGIERGGWGKREIERERERECVCVCERAREHGHRVRARGNWETVLRYGFRVQDLRFGVWGLEFRV